MVASNGLIYSNTPTQYHRDVYPPGQVVSPDLQPNPNLPRSGIEYPLFGTFSRH